MTYSNRPDLYDIAVEMNSQDLCIGDVIPDIGLVVQRDRYGYVVITAQGGRRRLSHGDIPFWLVCPRLTQRELVEVLYA